ncbi:Dabb family protein [Sphingomonas crocodyli]|uniref:Dabb family protein n=1 Tax=Sphingomonas crocodyli TaxID=1979270 RepID=A0A437LZP3_9SPHN|nr:Dabb family protein [Sphingomonas crocodyli]RVT90867.1 Dabb family protein [Sphingomonas crocodyli]
MFKQTALITFTPDSDAAARDALIARATEQVKADLSYVGDGLPVSFMGGDKVWHAHFADEAAWAASGIDAVLDSIEADPIVQQLDAAAYAVSRFAVPQPGLTDGVYRALFLSFFKEVDPAIEKQFADETAAMPDYIDTIVNWALNPVVKARGAKTWHYVWEQEYASLDGLRGLYMSSAYHWGHVDRWFDCEMPEFMIDDRLCHSASTLTKSVMADYAR